MTASAQPAGRGARARTYWNDYYADLTVIGLTILALLLGWVLKSATEARSVAFEGGGLRAQVPDGWVRGSGSSLEVLRASNPASAGFPTTYVIEVRPIAGGTTPAEVVSLLSLQRGQNLLAYRVLDQQMVTVNGRQAYKVTFVYVETEPNVMRASLPEVVRGVEFVYVEGERAISVAYHAAEENYEAEFGRFRQFLNSVAW